MSIAETTDTTRPQQEGPDCSAGYDWCDALECHPHPDVFGPVIIHGKAFEYFGGGLCIEVRLDDFEPDRGPYIWVNDNRLDLYTDPAGLDIEMRRMQDDSVEISRLFARLRAEHEGKNEVTC